MNFLFLWFGWFKVFFINFIQYNNRLGVVPTPGSTVLRRKPLRTLWTIIQRQMELVPILKLLMVSRIHYIIYLAWEPSIAHCTGYTRRLPAFERFYRETEFSLLKSTDSTWISKPSRTFPWDSRVSSIKIWDKSVKGFLSYDRRNKQTDKQRLQLNIYRCNPVRVVDCTVHSAQFFMLFFRFSENESRRCIKKEISNICWG